MRRALVRLAILSVAASAFVAALLDERQRRIERVVGQCCGFLNLLDFRRALEQAQARDDARGIGDLAEGL